MNDALLTTFKLLADNTRLNILGLLAEQPRSGDELAAILKLNPSTISQHLNRLQKGGLVLVHPAQYYKLYEVDFDRIGEMLGQTTAVSLTERVLNSDAIDRDAYRQLVLDRWVQANQVKGVPSQIQHRPVITAWLLEKFDQDKQYSQRQVADLLGIYCAPVHQKKWRRVLVQEGHLATSADKKIFWRADSPLADQPDFVPEQLPKAVLDSSIQSPRWRDGRLTQSSDPELHRRNIMAVALRLKAERPYTAAALDTLISTYSEADPATFRDELVAKRIIHPQEDGTYLRDPIGPEHPIWNRGG